MSMETLEREMIIMSKKKTNKKGEIKMTKYEEVFSVEGKDIKVVLTNSSTQTTVTAIIKMVYDDVIDIKIPFEDLGIERNDVLEFFFATSDNGIKDTYIPQDALLALRRG